VNESYAMLVVFLDHFDPPVVEQISPAKNLNLPVSNDELLESIDLVMAGVELLTGISLPLVKFLQKQFHACQHFH